MEGAVALRSAGALESIRKMLLPESNSSAGSMFLYCSRLVVTAGLMVFLTRWALKNFMSPHKLDKAMKDRISRLAKRRAKKLELTEHEAVIAADVVHPDEINVDFDSIGGLEAVKESISETLILPLLRPELFEKRGGKLLQHPKGILLYGPPGTGKTMLAKAIAREGHFAFINVRLSTINNLFHGESQKFIRSIFTLAAKLEPAIIFIDEIDGLFGQSHSRFEATMQMTSEFLSLWDGLTTNESVKVIVVGTTNQPRSLPDSILRRMPLQYQIDLPDKKQREEILRVLLANEPVADDVDIRYLASITNGYSGSDLSDMCKRAAILPLHDFLLDERRKKALAGNITPNPDTEGEAEEPSIRNMVLADFISALEEIKPTGQHAERFEKKKKRKKFNLEDGLLSVAQELMGQGLGRFQQQNQEEETEKETKPQFSFKERDNGNRFEEIAQEDRIAKWGTRFDGPEGRELLVKMCNLYGIYYEGDAETKKETIELLATKVLD